MADQKEKTKEKNNKENPVLIVAHTGLAQYFEYKTGFEVLPWSPEDRFDKKKTYRFIYNISVEELLHRLKLSEEKPLPGYENEIIKCNEKYLFIREDIWMLFLKSLSVQYDEELEKRIYFWKNPTRVRPSYLFK